MIQYMTHFRPPPLFSKIEEEECDTWTAFGKLGDHPTTGSGQALDQAKDKPFDDAHSLIYENGIQGKYPLPMDKKYSGIRRV